MRRAVASLVDTLRAGNRRRLTAICLLGALPALAAGRLPAGDSDYVPGTPFVYLFDTGSRSPCRLASKGLADKHDWTRIPEDDTGHAPAGDAVVLNDKLVVVLRREGPGAEVYAQTRAGPRLRAVVMAAPRGAVGVAGAPSIRIVENSLGAVTVEADFQAELRADRQDDRQDDGPTDACTARFRITTGQPMLELTGGAAAGRFFVWSNTRYVVVPDFFADDMVFTASMCDLPRLGLPAGNFLLNLIGGGDCLLMCVWPSAEQQAYAVATGEGPDRAIRGCEVRGGEGKTLTVAVLERPGLWHGGQATPKDDPIADWKPPFDAAWRVDRVEDEPFTTSFDLSKPQFEETFLGDGPRPEHADAPVGANSEPGGEEGARLSLVYPLDRNAATPLTALCPIDVLRNTLGVGPCQYVLETEGLATDTNPTPHEVADWVVKQFRANKQRESSGEVKRRLAAMADHVGRVEARIEAYAALAQAVRAECRARKDDAAARDAVETFTRILDEMERAIAAERSDGEPGARADELGGRIVELIGEENALDTCEALADEIHGIGDAQDKTLSSCRMAVRWLAQQARMGTIRNPRAAQFAHKIESRAKRFIAEP